MQDSDDSSHPAPFSPASAERLDFAMQACGIGVFLNPMPFGELVWNDNVKAHFHLPPDARVTIELFFECLHPQDREPVAAAIREAIEHRRPLDVTYRTVGPGGAIKWIRAVGRPRFDAAGAPTMFDGITLDVTAVMVGDERLRDSAERLRSFADTAPAILWVAEPDGAFSFLSKGWATFTGQKLDEALGFGWLEAVHPDDRDMARQAFTGANVPRTGFELEHRIRRADGGWSWVIDAGRPRFSLAGDYLGYVGSVTDISAHKLAEQRQRDSEERYRAFVANSTEGIWRLEFEPPVDTALPPREQVAQIYRHGRFAECNDALARMYGFSGATAVVGHGLGLVMPEAEEGCVGYLLSLITQGYRAVDSESVERDRSGNTRHFASNLSGVVENGLLVRAWGTQRDITDRKRAEKALVEADKRKDEFLAILAHELRNPLAPIRSAVEVMRLRGPPTPELDRSRAIIDRQVGHLTRLIDDLLDVSRITRDKLELRMQRVAVNEILHDAIENSRVEIDAGRHSLQLDLPAQALYLNGDPVRLVQVVMNLLTNASKYSAAGRPIWLRAAAEGGELAISVRDAGQGIASQDLPRVFEMFFQVERGLERPQGGLGIGLSLVQRLTQLHGGSVGVTSAGEGRGSEFTVRLPLQEAQPQPAHSAPSPRRSGPSALPGLQNILVVDDNQDSADTLAEVLRIMGYEVDTAYDGLAAVEKAASLRPCAVVLDLGMPLLNGYDACRRIRAQAWGRDIRVVALSGWGQQDDRRRSAEAGFDAHLVKPVAPEALIALLSSLRAEGAAGSVQRA